MKIAIAESLGAVTHIHTQVSLNKQIIDKIT